MVKVIHLLFFCSLFFFMDATAKEDNIIFHISQNHEYPDPWGYPIDCVTTESGKVIYYVSPMPGFEPPSKDARFFFPKLNDSSLYKAGVLHAIGLDGKEYTFRENPVDLNLLHFLQENQWEMDWDRIKELRKMATFAFFQKASSLWADNSYVSYIVKDVWLLYPESTYRALYPIGSNKICMDRVIPPYFSSENCYLAKSSSEEFFSYLTAVLAELEIELGAKLTRYNN